MTYWKVFIIIVSLLYLLMFFAFESWARWIALGTSIYYAYGLIHIKEPHKQ